MFPCLLILISFPLVYLWYVGFIVWALRRTHRGAIDAGRLRDWRITAWAMALLPFAGCAGALLMASQTENATALIPSFFLSGAFLLAAGGCWRPGRRVDVARYCFDWPDGASSPA